MGRAREKLNVDKKALKTYIIKNGYQLNNLSVQLGFTPNYLSDVLRPGVKKNITLPAYKYLCSIIGVSEDKFIKREQPKEVEVAKKPTEQTNIGMTPEQFNELLRAITSVGDTIAKALEEITKAQNGGAVIQGKIYGEVEQLADALGVHAKPTTTTKPITVKSQYANSFGDKKNG